MSRVFLSRIENITEAEKMVDEISEAYKLPTELYGKLLVATIEAVNNAIVHGNKLDETKKVKVDLQVSDKEICVKVTDQGTGFNPEDIPDPTLPENLENISGRGVFLMKKLSDKINYHQNGSIIELLFNR